MLMNAITFFIKKFLSDKTRNIAIQRVWPFPGGNRGGKAVDETKWKYSIV